MSALQFEAVKVALKQDRTGYVLTITIHPDEIPDELLRDYVGTRYGVAMVRIEADETARTYDNRVKTAGKLCRSKDFQDWVGIQVSLNATNEDMAIKYLYRKCSIASRTELNGNTEAQKKFDEMKEEYEHSKEPF